MTRPFRDPIIYPGTPLEPAVGRWVRLLRGGRSCALGGEVMGPDTVARWRNGLWECREHARPNACDGEAVA